MSLTFRSVAAFGRRPPFLAWTGLSLVLAAWPVPVLRAEDLDRELLKRAPAILGRLRDKGYANVGVLKFRTQKGKDRPTDNAGTFNLAVADRLELALLLADDSRQPVGILRRASSVAAKLPGASHLTRAGRQKLFEGRYPLAWGKDEVAADAFLTGVVQVDADLRRLTVTILAFDKGGADLAKVEQFTAAVGPRTLLELSESYLLLRGLVPVKADDDAVRVKEKKETFPLEDPAAPVGFEIRYDGRAVPVEVRDSGAFVREPGEGEKVSFVLRRKAGDTHRYGVVVKVNGESTLHRQRLPDAECLKWVLDPNDPPTTISGFQTTDQQVELFRVLSRRESKAGEIDYGADVGTITVAVFRDKQAARHPPDLPPDEDEDLVAVSRGLHPTQRPANLAALKAQLRAGAWRGLLGGGPLVEGGVRRVRFDPDPIPVLVATIIYYRP
jgi:hypothetical protein